MNAAPTVDLHCHLIPGIDDGSRSIHESVQMGLAIAEEGTTDAFVTPHQYRFGNVLARGDVERHVESVRRAFAEAGVSLRLHVSAETYFSERLLDALVGGEDLLTFDGTVAGLGPRCLLVELPTNAPVVGVERTAEVIARRGATPVMAHPERALAPSEGPERARRWVGAGWRLQLDLLSLVGAYGRTAQAAARDLIAEGLYHGAGSDLHHASQADLLRRARVEYRRLSVRRGDEVAR